MPESLTKKFKRWRRKRVFGEGYHWEDLDGPLPASTTGCLTCFGWSDYRSLEQSADANKCLCCRVVRNGLRVCESPVSLATARIRVHRKLDPSDWPQKIGLDLSIAGGYEYYEFYRGDGDMAPSVWPHFESRNNISGDTQSAEAFAWMSKRLERCLADHEACSRKSEAPLPTRVLEIRGLKGPSNSPVVRLVETNGEAAQYACLSHCWGKSQLIRTTRATIEQHKADIPWNALSKTFKDAIVVASQLGIPYIWIDSLCIVQDDPDDWKRESQRMYEVYANCVLTLAATKSSDGTGGCFSIASDVYRGRQVTDEHGGSPIHLYCRKKLAHESYRRNMRISSPHPLLTRAWVLQERLLAPRVLHFGPEEMFWECATEADCECGAAIKEEKSRKAEHYTALNTHVPPSHNSHQQTTEAVAKYWRDLVVNYSRMSLTYESDRLPAFHGISTLFKERRGDRYVSGLWTSSLVRDMLWHVYWTEPTANTKRGLFPSWSWASVNSHVEYQDGAEKLGKSKITILTQAEKNLVMMDYLSRVTMYYVPGGIPTPNASTPSFPGHRREVSMKYMLECQEEALKGERFQFDPDYVLEDTEQEEGRHIIHGQELFCLNLFETQEGWQYSLILNRLDAEGNVYERVGLAREPKGALYVPITQLSRVDLV